MQGRPPDLMRGDTLSAMQKLISNTANMAGKAGLVCLAADGACIDPRTDLPK